MAVTGADARLMIETAESNDRILMMASKFRYVQDVAIARSLIESGILGKIVLFENTFATHLDVSDRWNSDPEIAGGGVLIDNGTHSVDIARFLVGPVQSVFAYHGRKVQDIEVEDTSHISFRGRLGVVGTIDLSWSIQKEMDSYFDVFGTEGTLSIGWRASRYRQHHANKWVPFGQGYDKHAAFVAQTKNFVASCCGREQPLITHSDALASVLAIEAAYRSVEEGSWQEVPRTGGKAAS